MCIFPITSPYFPICECFNRTVDPMLVPPKIVRHGPQTTTPRPLKVALGSAQTSWRD